MYDRDPETDSTIFLYEIGLRLALPICDPLF